MPTIDWNKEVWDQTHHWELDGDEWSSAWKDSNFQWYFSIYPRIHNFLPANAVLEIGPGHGRWSRFLAGQCDELFLVDLSETCIEFCREQFRSNENVVCFANDGFSLDMIQDKSIDFVFSFDSLVHAEEDVIDSYLGQISRKLTNDGVGFIHHSNLGSFPYFERMRRLECLFSNKTGDAEMAQGEGTEAENGGSFLTNFVKKYRLIDRTHMRAITVTAEKFHSLAMRHGLNCISQEIITWGASKRPIDCLSILTRKNSAFDRTRRTLVNTRFMAEAGYIELLSGLYDIKTK